MRITTFEGSQAYLVTYAMVVDSPDQ